MKLDALLDRPGTWLSCVALPDHRMQNHFSPTIPYTLGYSATSKSTDSLLSNLLSNLWLLLLLRYEELSKAEQEQGSDNNLRMLFKNNFKGSEVSDNLCTFPLLNIRLLGQEVK